MPILPLFYRIPIHGEVLMQKIGKHLRIYYLLKEWEESTPEHT